MKRTISVIQQVKSDGGLASALQSSVLRLSRQIRWQGLDEAGLTANQRAVLDALSRHGRAMTVGELAVHENVKPPSMTRIVSDMEQAGLVRRTPHDLDKRQVQVDPTAIAIELMAANRRRREDWLRTRLMSLTPEERGVLRSAASILERIAAS